MNEQTGMGLDPSPLIGVMMVAIMGGVMVTMLGGTPEEGTPKPPPDEEEQVEQNPETGQYDCTLCSAEFGTYDDLYSHFIYVHPASSTSVEWISG